jgi:hypothetical protein
MTASFWDALKKNHDGESLLFQKRAAFVAPVAVTRFKPVLSAGLYGPIFG